MMHDIHWEKNLDYNRSDRRKKNFFLNISCWALSSDTREMCLINHSSMKDEEKEEKKGVIGKEGDKIDKI